MHIYTLATDHRSVHALPREVVSPNEASPSSFFPGAASPASQQQSNLHNLGPIQQLVPPRVGLSIHDMDSQYEEVEVPKKATKLEIKQNQMGFGGASSSTSGANAAATNEGTAETAFASPSEQQQQQQQHGHSSNPAASSWHQAHHHAQAYTSAQYPTGFFGQVTVNAVN